MRSIPAWAGETSRPSGRSARSRVYPRVGGGNEIEAGVHDRSNGLSPRGRGKQHVGGRPRAGLRSIPAWAGETLAVGRDCTLIEVYPRVGGGNLNQSRAGQAANGLSPRGWGKLRGYALVVAGQGSIPAWAGETRHIVVQRSAPMVYPRVGGGNVLAVEEAQKDWGLSPRGRGKRFWRPSSRAVSRSIPAWAGETLAAPAPAHPVTVYPRVGGGNGRRL